MSSTRKKFDFEALFAAKVKELKSTYNCKKCKSCQYRDCELATTFKAHQLFVRAAERKREYEALCEDLRQLAISTGGMPDRKPDLADFGSTDEAWGHA